MNDLVPLEYQPTIEDARALMPQWETVADAVDLVQQEFPTSRILQERCYLTLYQVCKDNGYADYVIQVVNCPKCNLLIYGQPPGDYCPKCREPSKEFETVEEKRCTTQADFLAMMEDTIGMKRATAYNRIQTYRRLCHGLGWSEEMAFAYHLWSGDTPRRIVSSLGRWARDGQLLAVTRPHRVSNVDKEEVVEVLASVQLLESPNLDFTDEELDLAMDSAIELMNEDGEVEQAMDDLTDLVKESLSQEIAGLVELKPIDAQERVRESLLGKGHLEWYLYHDRMGAVHFGLSYFQKFVDEDGLLCERGRTDRIVSLGILPPWVEQELLGKFHKANIAPKPPERFISAEDDELILFLEQFGEIAAGDTLLERVENMVRYYASQIGRKASG